jgi:hypothetical protein
MVFVQRQKPWVRGVQVALEFLANPTDALLARVGILQPEKKRPEE